MPSPHDVLGVEPGADDEAIEAAYRERVKEVHPDHGGSTSAFQLVRLAYEELQTDPTELGTTDAEGRAPSPYGVGPNGRRTARARPAQVEFLDYAAIEAEGWALGDDDLFEKAARADLAPTAHGQFQVQPGEYLLEAAEEAGLGWPFSCRGGACANCAVAVCEGEIDMAVDTVLEEEQLDRGIRLSCIGEPATDRLRVVTDVQRLPGLAELTLPPRSFGGAAGDD